MCVSETVCARELGCCMNVGDDGKWERRDWETGWGGLSVCVCGFRDGMERTRSGKWIVTILGTGWGERWEGSIAGDG
jgi:hypothetical protein